MHDDLPGGRHEEADPSDTSESGTATPEQARQIRFLEEEVVLLRRKLTDSPRQNKVLEQRLTEATERVDQLTERNNKLIETLREARGQLLALREEVDRLAQPPSGYGVFVTAYEDSTVDVFTSGRKMRVSVSPAVEIDSLQRGQALRLNEALTVVEGGDFERTGEVCALREVLLPETEGGSSRALVVGEYAALWRAWTS